MQKLTLMLVIGCGGSGGGGADSVLDDLPPATLSPDAVRAKSWAGQASAPNVFIAAQFPATAADLVIQANESLCPVKTMSGSTTTYEGGCTDPAGQTWTGRAIATTGSLTYEGFGWTGATECEGGVMVPEDVAFDGEVTFAGLGALTFDVDIVWHGTLVDRTACTSRAGSGAMVYSGRMEERGGDADGDGDPDQDVWSGSGRIGSVAEGVAEIETIAEVIDDTACEHEAASGSTTIRAGDHAIAITYDGATDCDMESTVKWSLDGADQGELAGVSCSTSSGGGGLLVLGVLGLLLRRRATRTAAAATCRPPRSRPRRSGSRSPVPPR